MEYFKNPQNQEVYGYDPVDQQDLINQAITNGWENITGSWPLPPTPEQIQELNKGEAVSKLKDTDWATESDVIDTTRNPHLLNQSDFLDYRASIRQIAVNPPITPVTNWPIVPKAVWSS